MRGRNTKVAIFGLPVEVGSGADPNPNLPVVPSETLQRAARGPGRPPGTIGVPRFPLRPHPQLRHHCPGGAGLGAWAQ